MSPEEALLVRAALVSLFVLALERLGEHRRKGRARRTVRTKFSPVYHTRREDMKKRVRRGRVL